MRSYTHLAALALASLLVACQPAGEQPVTVSNARAGATPPTATVGAAYFSIVSSQADRVLGASSPVAARVEFHSTTEEGGMMRMRAVAALQLQPGIAQELQPGGTHVMLMGLRSPLVAGHTFPLTLRLERGGEIAVDVAVVAPDALLAP